MATILITGGTGLIGKALSEKLIASGHEVRILSRQPKSTGIIKAFAWNFESSTIDEAAFDGIDHIVHLAGSGIADKRWADARKRDLIDSRVKSMMLLTDTVKKKNIKLKSFVGASAIGIYGMETSEKIYTETDKGTDDFLAHICEVWEKSYKEIETLSEKTTILRIGVVLSEKGGALKRLLPLFRFGLGSAVGSGKQYMPWIHVDDMVNVIYEALFNPQFKGTYNAVAPEHITNSGFSKELAKSLSKSFFMPNVPAFLMKLVFGEMANVLLEGSRVGDQKIVDTGFSFKYPTISGALRSISGQK